MGLVWRGRVVCIGGSAWESNPPKTCLMPPNGFEVPPIVFKLLNKLTVTELAQLSNFSKSYISQVKHGKCPPSRKLLQALQDFKGQGQRHTNLEPCQAIQLFLKSRREGLSPRTIEFYNGYIKRASSVIGVGISGQAVKQFLDFIPCSNGGKHAYYRTLHTFYHWLYSPKSGLGLAPADNPMLLVDPPKVEKKILPSLTPEQVAYLIDTVESMRDKAVISLFADSGLRLSELASIKAGDIDWGNHLIKVTCKGNKQGLAVFGARTEQLLKQWLAEYCPNGGSIWGINKWGIDDMLEQLRAKTGLPCNAHTFRRTFASVLAKRGIDSLHIMRLGRWESMAMVERYTRSVKFEDSLKLYSAIVS
jgi:site-specific recombinase XerD